VLVRSPVHVAPDVPLTGGQEERPVASVRPSDAAGLSIFKPGLTSLGHRTKILRSMNPSEILKEDHVKTTLVSLTSLVLMALPTGGLGLLMAAGEAPQSQPAAEPEHIEVQHILIAFSGTLPGKPIQRTQEEAKKLAYDILARAKKGDDYNALVKQYTDDSAPGIYGMSNVNASPAPGEYPRKGMVGAFGDVGFKLKVGEIGIADFDPKSSPFGYHIIKRTK